MPSRGYYRGVYSALIDDPDFQSLPVAAKVVFYTVRLCRDAGPAAIFRYYPEALAAQTGLGPAELEGALKALEAGRWIERDDVILWVRNGLRYDPHLRLADKKHARAVQEAVAALPRRPIVLRFCKYYKIVRPYVGPSKGLRRPSPGPTKGHRRASEDLSHRIRKRSTRKNLELEQLHKPDSPEIQEQEKSESSGAVSVTHGDNGQGPGREADRIFLFSRLPRKTAEADPENFADTLERVRAKYSPPALERDADPLEEGAMATDTPQRAPP